MDKNVKLAEATNLELIEELKSRLGVAGGVPVTEDDAPEPGEIDPPKNP
jgi:hypothetical protein